MSRKNQFIAGVSLGCIVLTVGFFFYLMFFCFHPSRKILKLEISPNTQVHLVRVERIRLFFSAEFENQKIITPEEFLKKMKKGEFKVVLVPKASSIESFRTIGFDRYVYKHVYVVEEGKWKDWFWKKFKFSKLCLPDADVKIKKERSQILVIVLPKRTIALQLAFPLVSLVIATLIAIFDFGRDLIRS